MEIDINEDVKKKHTAPIIEVKLNEDDLKLLYWQGEAECQKNWCEHYKQLSERYKQVVEEIKEILQNEHPFVDCSCGQDILQIIQKCEEVNNAR